MKKLFTLAMVFGLVGFAFAEHPASETAQTTEVEAKAVKSPWSAGVDMEVKRSVVGKAASATSNTTFFSVGRSVWGDVKLKATVPVANAFSPKQANSNIDRYLTLKDPYLTLSKGELLNVAGISLTGYARAYLPVTENSAHRGRDRNPNYGAYRVLVSASKEIDAWSLSATNLVQRYTALSRFTPKADVNPRWMMANILEADFKVNKAVTLGAYVEFDNFFLRSVDQDSKNENNELDAVLKADLSLVDKLSTTFELVFAAPNQNISKWNESAQSRLDNTSMVLTLSYSLL